MGIISEQLITLNQELQNAKNSINNKYNAMDMPSIDSLKINELSQKINDIPVLNTKDATASESDITKNKTAYIANQQKVSGTLQDYRNLSVSTSRILNGNSIKIKIPEGVYNENSNISIKLSDIATLINLDPGIIKDGETVLGVTGTYSKPPEGNFVDYDTFENMFNFGFKWGYWELGTGSESYIKTKMYARIYNAYYYNGQCDGYYVNDDKNTIYSCTYDHSEIGNSLSCYVYDLGLTPEDLNEIWGKVMYDSPELLIKFTNYYYTYTDGIVKYIFLDSFDKTTLNDYKNTCLNSFKEICNKIKTTYGINYVGGNSYYDCVEQYYYTVEQRVKIAKVIHDWLVLNNTYGKTEYLNLDQIMYSALCKGKYTTVCAGYAKAFQWCCQKFGIYTLPVIGYAGEYHMWNIVCYEQGYFNAVTNAWDNPSIWNEVDVTWDDPTDGSVTYCRWKFFNVTTSFLETEDGGNRTRAVHPEECYRKYISRCSCTKYKYNGSTQYGGL